MALDQETKDFIIAELKAELNARLQTRRVPELPENTASLHSAMQWVVYDPMDNKTKWETLADLATFLAVGGDLSTIPPDSADKGRYPFDVTQEMIDAGGDGKTIYLPQFAGKNFLLRIDGRDFIDNEYDILSAGGFTITDPDFDLYAGARATLDFAEKIADGATPSASSGGFIRGKVAVSSNTTLTADDVNKVIQIRSGSTAITVTLLEASGLAENSFFIFDATIGNSKENRVTTQSGQNIYINSTSKTSVYVRPGETFFILKDPEGWYIIDAGFIKIYQSIANIYPSLHASVETDEIIFDGSEKNRADYPRFWEKINASGTAIVDETDWQLTEATTPNGNTVPFPNRGKFSRGNGSTTFRVPDWRGLGVMGLAASDDDRTSNTPGNYQKASIDASDLTVNTKIRNGSGGSGTNPLNAPTSGFSGTDNLGSWLDDTTNKTWLDISIDGGGNKTVMDNAAVYWKAKV